MVNSILTHEEKESNPEETHSLHAGAPHPWPVDGEGCEVVADERHKGVEAGPQHDLEEGGRGVDDLDKLALE